MAEDWITTHEAAEISGYHPVHLRRLIRAGKVSCQRCGRDWHISRSSLLDYLKYAEDLGEKRGPKPGS